MPRGQWPAARLLPSSARPDEILFSVDDRWGVAVRWQGEHAVQIMAVLRRTVEVVSTEAPRSVWNNPDALLALAVVALVASVVFFLLWAIERALAHQQGPKDIELSPGNQIMGILGWLSLMAGIFLLLRRFFRSR